MDEFDIVRAAEKFLKISSDIFQKFSSLKIAVFGDSMLDEYLIGDSTRISPEAPVPVVKIEKVFYKPGGAANTAVNMKKMGGGYVKLFSVSGDDGRRNMLLRMLRENGVEVFVPKDPSRPTTTKTRAIARGQQVIRIDSEKTHDISREIAERIISEFEKEKFDVVVFSDYEKGFFTEQIAQVGKKVKCICDPKPRNIHLFKGIHMILPNRKEVEEIFKMEMKKEMIDIERDGMALKKKLGVQNIVITRGGEGMTVLTSDDIFHVPALARDVYDVTGAGDTVTASFALCEAAGVDKKLSAIFASAAASVKVSHRGTYTPDKNEIIMAIKDFQKKNKLL